MARATRFPVEAFERGRLPDFCVLSGEPTADRMRVTVSNRPAVGLLLLVGIIPYVIVKAIMIKTVVGTLPMTEEVYLAVKARQRSGIPFYVSGLVIGILGLVVSFVSRPGIVLIVVGILVVVSGRIWAAMKDPLQGLRLDSSGRWVELANASDAFSTAVSALLQAGAL